MPLYIPPQIRILGASAVPASNAADTAELALATVNIPAGAMGLNGRLRIETSWTFTNSSNNKTLKIRFGGIGGTALFSTVRTTSDNHFEIRSIANRNSASSQVSQGAGSNFGGFTGGLSTATIDTSAATTLVITGQKATAGETLTLESYMVELIIP